MHKVGHTFGHFAIAALPRAIRSGKPLPPIAQRALSTQSIPNLEQNLSPFQAYSSGQIKFSESIRLAAQSHSTAHLTTEEHRRALYSIHNAYAIQADTTLTNLTDQGKITPERAFFLAFKHYCEDEQYLSNPHVEIYHPKQQNLFGQFLYDKRDFLNKILNLQFLYNADNTKLSLQRERFSEDEVAYFHQKGLNFEDLLADCHSYMIAHAERLNASNARDYFLTQPHLNRYQSSLIASQAPQRQRAELISKLPTEPAPRALSVSEKYEKEKIFREKDFQARYQKEMRSRRIAFIGLMLLATSPVLVESYSALCTGK